VYFQVDVKVSGAYPLAEEMGARLSFRPLQPPTSFRLRNTIGSRPITIIKNCKTSL